MSGRFDESGASRTSKSVRSIRSNPASLVPGKGLEPPQCYHRMDLNHVRLPIPPPGHARRANLIIKATFVNENAKIPRTSRVRDSVKARRGRKRSTPRR